MFTTWARTEAWSSTHVFEPRSVGEVQEIVTSRSKGSPGVRRTLRVVGSLHSPNDCARSDDATVSLRHLHRIDPPVPLASGQGALVTAQAGATLQALNVALAAAGFALENLGSISDQQLGGGLLMGTHGTGPAFGIMASNVTELTLVAGDGSLVRASKSENPDVFSAALVSFGCIGVVVSITLRVVPAFDLVAVESPAPFGAVVGDLAARVASSDHYRVNWFPHTGWCSEYRATRMAPLALTTTTADAPAAPPASGLCASISAALAWLWGTFLGFHVLQFLIFASIYLPAGFVPLVNRLYRYLYFSQPSAQRRKRSDLEFSINCLFWQYTNEWALPAERASEALVALNALLAAHAFEAHFPVEVRFVAADDIWLSPAYGRATVYIGFVMYRPYGRTIPYQALFARVDEVMLHFGGRPHWAKNFQARVGAEAGEIDFARTYPHWGDFLRVRERMDPRRLFVNDFVQRMLRLPPMAEGGAGGTQ